MSNENRKVSQQEQELWAATQAGIPIERARAYIELAQLEEANSKFKDALPLYEVALGLIEAEAEVDYALDLVQVLYQIAQCLNFLGRNQEEIEVIKKALNVATECGVGDLPALHRAAGYSYYSLMDYENSVKNHQAALNYPDPDAGDISLAIDQLNIGTSLSKLKRFDEAIEILKIARDLFKRLKEPKLVAICDGEIAENYVELNDAASIEKYGQLALGTAEMVEDRQRQWWLHYFLAVAKRLQGELDDSICHLETGRSLAISHGYQEFAYLVKVDCELAKIYRSQGLDQQAEKIERRVKTVAEILEAA